MFWISSSPSTSFLIIILIVCVATLQLVSCYHHQRRRHHRQTNDDDNCTLRETHLTCREHLPQQENHYYSNNTRTLELHNVQKMEIVDVNYVLRMFPRLENFSIIDGNLSKFVTPRSANNAIKVIQLINVGVEHIGKSFFVKFPKLEVLNLAGNNLQDLRLNLNSYNLKSLHLAGNKWNCSLDLDWVHNLNKTIVKDLQNLTCFGFPHGGRSLLTIAQFTKEMKNQCTANCNCTLPKVVPKHYLENYIGELIPVIEVNCSTRGLTELPHTLPRHTKILRLEGNDITSLRALSDNPMYRGVVELYVDNNRIGSIEELEGIDWLQNFRVLSLSGNRLTQLPTYALDNALQQNINMPKAVRIFLGGNPWRCDCVFTPVFQEMLQKFQPQINDVRDVKCSYVEGDENSLLPIIELSRSSVCRLRTEYSVQALDLLNGVLASLIVLVLGKLAYDYYYFKKTGQLPWIVTKMP